jgi:hypothetical protein
LAPQHVVHQHVMSNAERAHEVRVEAIAVRVTARQVMKVLRRLEAQRAHGPIGGHQSTIR